MENLPIINKISLSLFKKFKFELHKKNLSLKYKSLDHMIKVTHFVKLVLLLILEMQMQNRRG